MRPAVVSCRASVLVALVAVSTAVLARPTSAHAQTAATGPTRTAPPAALTAAPTPAAPRATVATGALVPARVLATPDLGLGPRRALTLACSGGDGCPVDAAQEGRWRDALLADAASRRAWQTVSGASALVSAGFGIAAASLGSSQVPADRGIEGFAVVTWVSAAVMGVTGLALLAATPPDPLAGNDVRAARNRWVSVYAQTQRQVVLPAVVLGLLALTEIVGGAAIVATTSGQSPEGVQIARNTMGANHIIAGVYHTATLLYALGSHAADAGTYRVLTSR